jgi:hypothetical protein
MLLSGQSYAAFPIGGDTTQTIITNAEHAIPNDNIPKRHPKEMDGANAFFYGLFSLVPLAGFYFAFCAMNIGSRGFRKRDTLSIIGFILGVLGLIINIASFIWLFSYKI